MTTRSAHRAVVWAAWLALLAPAVLPAQPPAIGDPADLTLRISVDQLTYPVGTPVEIVKSTCNETPDLIRYNVFFQSGPYLEILDDSGNVVAFAQPDGGNGAGRTVKFEPGQCRLAVYEWHQSSGRFDHPWIPLGPPVPPGIYRVRGPFNLGPGISLHALSPRFGIGQLPTPVPSLGDTGLVALAGALALAAAFLLRR